MPDSIRESALNESNRIFSKELTLLRQRNGRAQVVQISSLVAKICKWQYMPVIWFWLSAAVMILPVISTQWKPLAGFSNFCPAVLAQETAGESQPSLPSTPQPPTEEQPATDTVTDSTTESEQAPVADSVSSSAADSEKEQTPDLEPDASAEPEKVPSSDSQEPPESEPEAKPSSEMDDKAPEPDVGAEDVPPLSSSGDTRWDKYHDALSRRIMNSAEWIDSFFDDERVESEENRTNIKLRFDTEVKEGDGIKLRVRGRIRLVLPKMRKRLSLVLSGDPDEDTREGTIGDNIGGEQFDNKDERNLTASVWYFFLDTYKRNLLMRFGARWRDGGPVFWLGPRYRQLWTFDPWAARYTWSLRWFTDVGLESRMRLDMERPITKTLFFRQTTSFDWDQEEDVDLKEEDGTIKENTVTNFNKVGFAVSIFQPLSRRAILEYATGVSFVNKPEYVMDNVDLLVKYRRQFWRDWLFFEITPALEFPWIRDYKAVPSILFRIEGLFGKYE